MNDALNGSAPGNDLTGQQIHIDTSAIPSYLVDVLAPATIDLIYAILQQPGGREALDARTAARYAAAAAK